MARPQKVTISLARIETYIEVTSEIIELLGSLRPKNDKGKVDWKTVHKAWGGIVELHNSLAGVKLDAEGKEYDDWPLFQWSTWIDNLRLFEIEKKILKKN